jgi:DNA ligase 1
MVLVQPKLDGDRVRAEPSIKGYTLKSSQDNEVRSLPHIKEALDSSVEDLHLDGEAYNHDLSHQKIRSIVSRTVNLHPSHEDICYVIYDIVDLDTPQEDRALNLSYLDLAWPLVYLKTFKVDKVEINKYLYSFIEEGFEGVIIRDPRGTYEFKRSSFLLKLKPTHEESFAILDSFEAISMDGELKDTLGGLWVQDMKGQIFKCGAGQLTHEERDYWWDRRPTLLAKRARIKYLVLTDSGIPREPILVALI